MRRAQRVPHADPAVRGLVGRALRRGLRRQPPGRGPGAENEPTAARRTGSRGGGPGRAVSKTARARGQSRWAVQASLTGALLVVPDVGAVTPGGPRPAPARS